MANFKKLKHGQPGGWITLHVVATPQLQPLCLRSFCQVGSLIALLAPMLCHHDALAPWPDVPHPRCPRCPLNRHPNIPSPLVPLGSPWPQPATPLMKNLRRRLLTQHLVRKISVTKISLSWFRGFVREISLTKAYFSTSEQKVPKIKSNLLICSSNLKSQRIFEA